MLAILLIKTSASSQTQRLLMFALYLKKQKASSDIGKDVCCYKACFPQPNQHNTFLQKSNLTIIVELGLGM